MKTVTRTSTSTSSSASASIKRVRKGSSKSPFELNNDQKKLVSSHTSKAKRGVEATEQQYAKQKVVSRKGDKKAQLRAVQDQRKEKDAKLKALSNRIAWLKSEEERAKLKVGELNNLIHIAEEKDVTAEDVKFRTALTHGKEQVLKSKQNVKKAAKEHVVRPT